MSIDDLAIEKYAQQPYAVMLVKDGAAYAASIPDLPGCESIGKSPEEALRSLEEMKRLWIQSQLEDGSEIPEPRQLEDFSGRFVLRIPRSLHWALETECRREGVSLNTHILTILAARHAAAASKPSRQALEAEVSLILPRALMKSRKAAASIDATAIDATVANIQKDLEMIRLKINPAVIQILPPALTDQGP